jgi:hypothetical protein
VAYNSKVILIALGKIARKADSIEEVYEAIQEMANAEGVILKPFDADKNKGDDEHANNA